MSMIGTASSSSSSDKSRKRQQQRRDSDSDDDDDTKFPRTASPPVSTTDGGSDESSIETVFDDDDYGGDGTYEFYATMYDEPDYSDERDYPLVSHKTIRAIFAALFPGFMKFMPPGDDSCTASKAMQRIFDATARTAIAYVCEIDATKRKHMFPPRPRDFTHPPPGDLLEQTLIDSILERCARPAAAAAEIVKSSPPSYLFQTVLSYFFRQTCYALYKIVTHRAMHSTIIVPITVFEVCLAKCILLRC